MMLEHTFSHFVLIKDKKMSVVSVFLKYSVLVIHATLITYKKTWQPHGVIL